MDLWRRSPVEALAMDPWRRVRVEALCMDLWRRSPVEALAMDPWGRALILGPRRLYGARDAVALVRAAKRCPSWRIPTA